ncbi:hypothetical protein UY3_08639 [Chelonia mydas]|uniref:Uncharacterized protein n=1 Tax=Chelonia mydas TaxID=8469 RepID=M7BF44_CHEMY|nr:hypothetical protein UY3_08639 [Chelonia mydas]
MKELRNAHHKVWEGNHHSGAVPTSSWFYEELDAILGGDPTSPLKATVDTSVACMPVESGLSQEEEILDEDVEREGDPEGRTSWRSRDACCQELFSTPEEASQSQQSDLGKAQTGEEAPEWKEWWDSEKRDRKENVAHQNEAPERLLNVMELQVDTLQAILALQTKQLRDHPPLQPLLQSSFLCAPQTPPTHSYQPPGSSLHPLHSSAPPSQSSPADSHYTQHPSLCSLALLKYRIHCTVFQAALYSKGEGWI